ncbi:uncharacterized protein LOC112682378 [Sipha flava]|uniref:Uncharacterized protein LOC112682378 n=1 Tax=Sipha flava TaxID=143950 RepID=A0A8B8FCY7_9HEMI|nr:uncharacterized protein LOC112682378 [Sipha flava]
MPKIINCSARLRNFVKEFGEDIFSCDNAVLFCKVCGVKESAEKKYNIQQHIARGKHIQQLNIRNQQEKPKSQLLVTGMSMKSSFNEELCNVFLSTNIPLTKLNIPTFRDFLHKHTKQIFTDESTLRKNYIDQCYTNTIIKIRDYVRNKNVWVSIDETTDVEERYVANVIIGTLEVDNPGKIFLLNSEVLEKANHSTISKLFDRSLFILWPEGILYDNVLLFVSDAAPYMVKSGKSLQVLYSKMVHITCLAHGLHRVAEQIRINFPEINSLISNIKKVFLKAPYRINLFKNLAPGIPLPPELIIAPRWGTWLNAVNYYCEHFLHIKNVILQLDSDDALAIKNAKKLVENPEIEKNLIYIKSNFGFLATEITRLETSGMLLSESVCYIEKVKQQIKQALGKTGETVTKKLDDVLNKNSGFKILTIISNILKAEKVSREELPEDLTCDDLIHYKFAPITSVDVERSFSKYKHILSDRRRKFLFENLKKILIVQCNSDDID